MPRDISSANQDALEERALVARDFLWIVARTRGSPVEEVTDGMWSDVGNVIAQVVNPDTLETEERTFYGSGTLISISDIPLVASLTVQRITVQMSQVEDRVNDLVRTYDCRQARIEVFRGLFSPDTRQLVSPAEARFVGFVDDIEIKTPREGEEGAVILYCTSHTQEMTRSNPDTRSHESQKRRSSSDNFFEDAGVVGEWNLFWGKKNGLLTG